MKLTECLDPDRGRTPKKPVGQSIFVDLGAVRELTPAEVRQASRFTASFAVDAGDARLLLDILGLLPTPASKGTVR